MIVADRDQNVLQTGYLDWSQLDDELAIVAMGGKESLLRSRPALLRIRQAALEAHLGQRSTADGQRNADRHNSRI